MIRTLHTATLAALLLSSCVVAIEADGESSGAYEVIDHTEEPAGEAAPMALAMDEEPAGEATAAEEQPEEVDLEALEVARDEARGNMEKARLGAQISQIEAESRLDGARADLEAARIELEHFEAVTAPRELAEKELSLDRSKGRLFEAEAELAQLVAMYEDEEFATSSKELVLERGRRGVDFSKRSLALAEEALEDHAAFSLTQRREKLARAIHKAEIAVDLAELRLQSARLGADLDEERMHRKLVAAEEALHEAQAKVEAGEAVVKE